MWTYFDMPAYESKSSGYYELYWDCIHNYFKLFMKTMTLILAFTNLQWHFGCALLPGDSR